jgi:excisionase family DNA binding protein
MTPADEKLIIDLWHELASKAAMLTLALIGAHEQASRVSAETPAPEPDGNGHDELMTPQEAADYLKIDHSTVHRFIKKNKIPAVRLDKVIRVRKSDLLALIEQQITSPR